MSDAENFQQFQTHMMAFFGHMFNTVKVVVQSVPAAGTAGHLLQMAEASLNAAKVAAEETWKASEAPAEPAPAPEPPPAPPSVYLPATFGELAKLIDDPAADPAVKAMAAEKMQKMLAAPAPAPVPAPLPPEPVVEPAPAPEPAPEAPAVDVGVPPDYPQPDHSQP